MLNNKQLTPENTTLIKITSEQVLGTTEQHLCSFDERVFIHQAMNKAFNTLASAAKKAGIELTIASGFRSFDRQLMLWNNKFSGKTPIKTLSGDIIAAENLTAIERIYSILLYSALPGASRHHWGSDIDVYAPNLLATDYQLQLEPWEYSKEGPLKKLSFWLEQNAHLFGFYFPYASFQGGVAAEPWHLSYLPLAQRFEKVFNINQLAKTLENSDILGKKDILNNLDEIAKRFINNVCVAPSNVIIPDNF